MSEPENGVKRFKDMTLIEQLRNNLQPQGTAPLVGLKPMDSSGIWMHADFVTKCLDELERMPVRVALGDRPTCLEQLAYQLLLDSAYIVLDKKPT